MPCGSRSPPRSAGDDHAFASAAGVAVTSINLKSIPQRLWLSLSTVIAVALVVIVLLAFLAMANGFQRTLRRRCRGHRHRPARRIAGRDQQHGDARPGAADRGGDRHRRATEGKPLVSAELYLMVDGLKRHDRPRPTCRCAVSARRARRAQGHRITEGRMFNPGANEIVVGKALLREFQGFELGRRFRSPPAGGPWSACSRPTAACSNPRSGLTCRWCRASSTATTSSRPCDPAHSPAALSN